ncbi:hypothetical protein RhiirC2_739231 [Rhizophagus irregularis]|uniref:Uncharacterized protein n=1 Tax=Rhizophagus irregularis TaxID=588596 RepID=A0A2N1NK64_9GLOM|nr:hypothetical protein RhiirC2_739231 [Rhizophagus irregularis]
MRRKKLSSFEHISPVLMIKKKNRSRHSFITLLLTFQNLLLIIQAFFKNLKY